MDAAPPLSFPHSEGNLCEAMMTSRLIAQVFSIDGRGPLASLSIAAATQPHL